MTTDPRPLTEDIPANRFDPTTHTDHPYAAWRTGRRIYVACPYRSTVNTAVRELGARWDADARALWLGYKADKAEAIVELIRAAYGRRAEVMAVKAAGHWVRIPYAADDPRTRAKTAGAVYDHDRKAWAFPTAEAAEQVAALVRSRKDAEQAALDEQRQASRQAEQTASQAGEAEAAARKTARLQEVIAASGRTVTDERGTGRGRLDGYLRRPQAEAARPQVGTVRRLRDGRRVLVLACSVQFISQDQIDDQLVDLSTAEDAGWWYWYDYAVLVPTADEVEEDQAVRAAAADHRDIHSVMRAAAGCAGRCEVDILQQIQGPSITADSIGSIHNGRITLGVDGTVWWQHPGYPDDWSRTEGQIVDPDLIGEIKAILAGGTRRRGPYQVSVPTTPKA